MNAGHFVVFALTLVSLFAGTAVASRIARPGADGALAICMLTCGQILLPIHALGFAHRLTAVHLGGASLVLSAALVVGSRPRKQTWRAHAQGTFAFLRDTVARAASLLCVDLRRSGPFAWATFGVLCFALGYASLLTWYLPADSWDGAWYHDIMVGHAIQSHSYETIPLPLDLTQQANGYPRNAEMLGLWWVIFSGRRLLEWPSVLTAIPMALACYALCTRFAPHTHDRARQGRWRSAAFVCAVALVVFPGFRLEMRSTYIDGIFSTFSLAGLYFASDPRLNAKRSLLATLSIGLALGSKSHALLSMPPLAVLALGIVLVNEGLRGWRRSALATLAGVALVVAFGGVTYIRNWLWYDNPFYPITVSLGPWKFVGLLSFDEVNTSIDVLADLFAFPTQGGDWPDPRRGAYGMVTGFVLLPATALALLVLPFSLTRQLVRAVVQRRLSATLGERFVLVLTSLTVLLSLALSPQLWSARYNLYAVGFAFALIHWLASTLRTSALASQVGIAGVVTSCVLWSWSLPSWWGARGWTDLKQLIARPRWADVGAPSVGPPTFLDPKTTVARERELKAGDVVVWTHGTDFPSFLWNDRYSNVVLYVPPSTPEQFLEKANQLHAKWISVSPTSPVRELVRAHPEQWVEIGPLHHWGGGGMFVSRRIPKP